jgi:hypothetical protein
LVAPNALNPSGRGGRDRRSNFYEVPDNLGLMCAPANHTATEQHHLDAAVAEAERKVHDTDEEMERELEAWGEKQSATV